MVERGSDGVGRGSASAAGGGLGGSEGEPPFLLQRSPASPGEECFVPSPRLREARLSV